jgi:hypothetical protein
MNSKGTGAEAAPDLGQSPPSQPGTLSIFAGEGSDLSKYSQRSASAGNSLPIHELQIILGSILIHERTKLVQDFGSWGAFRFLSFIQFDTTFFQSGCCGSELLLTLRSDGFACNRRSKWTFAGKKVTCIQQLEIIHVGIALSELGGSLWVFSHSRYPVGLG